MIVGILGRTLVSISLTTFDSTPGGSTPEPPPAESAGEAASPTISDIFPVRIQASLFILLIAFLGLVGWKTWQPSPPHIESRAASAGGGKVDLNRADRADLLLLHGIGPELADRIITYREAHGPFEGLSDLRRVKGIGPATLDLLRPRVVLSWTERPESKPTPGPSIVAISPAALATKSADAASILDPNRATLAELQTLPGIGPKKAKSIVDQRAQRSFVEIGDLRKVPGIGPKTFEQIKPRLRIGDGTSARLQ